MAQQKRKPGGKQGKMAADGDVTTESEGETDGNDGLLVPGGPDRAGSHISEAAHPIYDDQSVIPVSLHAGALRLLLGATFLNARLEARGWLRSVLF